MMKSRKPNDLAQVLEKVIELGKKRGEVIINDPSLPVVRFSVSATGIVHDPTVWSLILANLFAAARIFMNDIPLSSFLIAYWIQSVIIGVFVFIRILCLKDTSTEGIHLQRWHKGTIHRRRINDGIFFLLHYGAFHGLYLFMIIVTTNSNSGKSNKIDWPAIVPIAVMFFLNHLYSFFRTFREQTRDGQSVGIVASYARIVPMHLVGPIAAVGQVAVIPFLLIKTLLDVLGHILTHVSPVNRKFLPLKDVSARKC